MNLLYVIFWSSSTSCCWDSYDILWWL